MLHAYSGEAANNNIKVFGLNQPRFELTFYCTPGEHDYKFSTDAIALSCK